MTRVSLIRGAFLNPFELQSYYPLTKKFDIQAISSRKPINDKIKLPLVKLWSWTDLPTFPYKSQILNRLFRDEHYLFGLDRVLEGEDIAHVAETYYYYTYQAVRAKEKGLVKKVVSTVWENIPHNNETLKGRKSIKNYTHSRIDHFVTVTLQAREALIAEGVDKSKITVVPPGIDLTRFTPGPLRREVLNILYVGRFVPEKGVVELLESFAEIKKQFPKIKLTMIGDGPLADQVKAVAQVKKVPYSGIHKEYQKADIFVLPSKGSKTWQEQFGMVLLEAMASGLPVVTTISGAMKEVCAKAALYADPGNAQDLSLKIIQVIKDLKKRQEMRKRSLVQVRQYDIHKIARRIEEVYRRVGV